MLKLRFMLPTALQLLQICLLLPGAAAPAQDSPGQWVGGLYHVESFSNTFKTSSVLIDESNKVHKVVPDFAIEKNFFRQREFSSSSPHWHDGALYAVSQGSMGRAGKNGAGPGAGRWTFAKWEDGAWRPLGHYKMGRDDNMLEAIPCDGDRFIVVFHSTRGMGPEAKSKMTPFHVMSARPGETEFAIERAIDHGQEALRSGRPSYFKLPWMGSVIMTGRHATLLSKATGLYWVFSLGDASLVRAGNIFAEGTAKMVLSGGFANSPVLCANPEKSGTVLIAAQEDAFFTAEARSLSQEVDKLLNAEPYRRMPMEEFYEKVEAPLVKEFADRSPFIAWYRLHPETGEVERLKAPPLGGPILRDGGRNDIWRPMPDGSVGEAPHLYPLMSGAGWRIFLPARPRRSFRTRSWRSWKNISGRSSKSGLKTGTRTSPS